MAPRPLSGPSSAEPWQLHLRAGRSAFVPAVGARERDTQLAGAHSDRARQLPRRSGRRRATRCAGGAVPPAAAERLDMARPGPHADNAGHYNVRRQPERLLPEQHQPVIRRGAGIPPAQRCGAQAQGAVGKVVG